MTLSIASRSAASFPGSAVAWAMTMIAFVDHYCILRRTRLGPFASWQPYGASPIGEVAGGIGLELSVSSIDGRWGARTRLAGLGLQPFVR